MAVQATFRECSWNPGLPAPPARARAPSALDSADGRLDFAAARRARVERGAAPERARRGGGRSRRACAAGARAVRRGAARLHAARRDRGADRPAPDGVRARARGSRAARPSSMRRWTVARTPARPLLRTHDLGATAIVVHTSGTSADAKPIELTYGNWLWSALGSAVALGLDPGRALAVHAAAVACRRAVDPAAQHDLRDDRGAARRLRRCRGGRRALGRGRRDARVRRADDARTAARRRPAAPPGAARGARRRRADRAGAARARARRPGSPTVTTYGLTEACSQVTTGGPALFCTRVRIGPRR